jgi:hypothetical protein
MVRFAVRITRNTQTRCGAKRAVFNTEAYIYIYIYIERERERERAKPINLPLWDGRLKTVTSQGHGRVQHWSDAEASVYQPARCEDPLDCFLFPSCSVKNCSVICSIHSSDCFICPSVCHHLFPGARVEFSYWLPSNCLYLLYIFPISSTQVSPYGEADSSSTN